MFLYILLFAMTGQKVYVLYVAIAVIFLIIGAAIGHYVIPAPIQVKYITKPPEPLYKIKIGMITAYFESNLPVLVAIANGYFEEERVDVEIVSFKGGSEVRKALIAGEIDFGSQSSAHAGIAQNAGADLRLIVATFELSTIDILVRNELKDQIKSLSDLKGKKIGVTRFGSLTWVMANKYVSMAGLDPEKDVTIVEVGSDPAAIASALKAGEIDVYMGWTIITYKMEKEGIATPLLNILNPEQHKKYVGPASLEAGITTMGKTADEKPDLVMRVVSAIKKALIFMATHTPEEIVDVVLGNKVTAEFAGLSREDLLGMLNLMMNGFSKDGAISEVGWEYGPYNQLVKFLPEKFKPVAFDKACDIRFAGMKR